MKTRALSLAALLLIAALADARRAAPPPVAVRVAQADVTLVGKVTGLDDKTIPAPEKGDDRKMQVAFVEVSDALVGKPAKKVKVGFFAPAGRVPGAQLEAKDEGLFFLQKHPTAKDTYYTATWYAVTKEKDNPGFKAEVEEAKKAAKTLAEPMKGLKAKDADERYLTAALLLTRYRTARTGAKLETVPAAESRLILEALAEADWTGRDPKFYGLNPVALFGQMGVTEKDGWKAPADFAKFGPEASVWLKANAGKFKLQRYVPGEAGPSVEP